jgi:hypothetical protein
MTRQDMGTHSLRVIRGVDAATARLSRVVLALASPPPSSDASRLAKGVPGQTENLVLEFDEAYTAFVEGFEALPSERQMLTLQAMDARLSAMVRAKDAAIWTEVARREASDWQEVRRLATEVLSAFDWPMELD